VEAPAFKELESVEAGTREANGGTHTRRSTKSSRS